MEICSISCLLSLVFLIAAVYKFVSLDKELYHKDFVDLLTEEQLKKYKKIVEERKSICFEGYGMGLVVGIILVIFNVYQKKRKLTRLSMACIVASTMFIVQYFYYILYPKSDWILLHLNTDEQKKKWLDIYRVMQRSCHEGVALGIAGAGALGNIMC